MVATKTHFIALAIEGPQRPGVVAAVVLVIVIAIADLEGDRVGARPQVLNLTVCRRANMGIYLGVETYPIGTSLGTFKFLPNCGLVESPGVYGVPRTPPIDESRCFQDDVEGFCRARGLEHYPRIIQGLSRGHSLRGGNSARDNCWREQDKDGGEDLHLEVLTRCAVHNLGNRRLCGNENWKIVKGLERLFVIVPPGKTGTSKVLK
jgi:hypothetical protein